MAHSEALNHGEALYPYWKSNLKAFSLPAGISSYTVEDLYNGLKPSRLIVAFVLNDAYGGNLELNPFNFKPFDLSFLQFTVDGNSVPEKAFQPNFQRGDWASAYYRMFFDQYHDGNFITFTEFSAGYSFFCFNLDGQITEDVMVEQRYGQCRLEMAFRTALAKSVSMIVYAHFPAMLKVDKTRNTILV